MTEILPSLSELTFISEENIVENLRTHYESHSYYQKVGQVFLRICSAPSHEAEFYNTSFLNELDKWSKASRDKSLAERQHLFKFAEELRRFACDGNKSQALILRGMNGSGKTDSVKKILQYLSFMDMSFHPEEHIARDFSKPFGCYANPFYITSDASMVSKRMAATITLLESFYTAPTDHNLNSSRVCTHYKVRYTMNGKLSGYRVDALFPNFARCNPKDLYIGPLTIQTILVNGLQNSNLDFLLIPGSLREQYPPVAGVDYTAQLNHLKEVLLTFGGTTNEIWDPILKVVAAVINLQGITLLGTESAIISSSTKSLIGQAEQLLGIESGTLGPAVLKKPDERIGRPSGSVTDCKPLEAKFLLEYLCSELIHRTVSFLLNEMAYNYPLEDHHAEEKAEAVTYSTLHILDTMNWDRNALNQHGSLITLMNHYCEEKLSNHYLTKAFTDEIDRYGREGIVIETVSLPDWNLQLDIIERQVGGVIQILEEGCQNPRSEDKSMADKIILNHNKSRLVKTGGAKTKQTVFIIKHSFADVSYDCEGFLVGNRYDHLPPTLLNALKSSKIPFIAREPPLPIKLTGGGPKEDQPTLKVIRPKPDHKMASPTTFALYQTRWKIESIIEELNQCEKMNYLLCINPNFYSRNGDPTPNDYLTGQIKAVHLEGLIRLAQSGFAYSRPYHDIYRRFRILLPFSNSLLPLHITQAVESNYQQYCKQLLEECVQLHQLCLQDQQWESNITYGHNVLFMKEKFAIMLESYRFNYYEQSNLSCLLVQSIIRMRKWRVQYLLLRKGIISLQSIIRRRIQRRRFLFALKSALWIKSLIIVHYRRQRFLKMSTAANLLKKRLLGKAIQRIRYKRLMRAAKSFHALAKGFVLRRYTQNVYDSIRLIQRTAKAFVLRRRIARIRLAAVLRIQYNFRGYKCRMQYFNSVQVLRIRKEQRIAQRVVKKIQSLWRKKLVVERFQEIVSAVVVIQRWLKSRLRYRWYQLLKQLVKKVQSHWRRIQATKYVNALKVANMVKLEKESLTELYIQETSCLVRFPWQTCQITEGISSDRSQKFKRLLFTFDFCFDLSFSYNDGWLKTFFDFQRQVLFPEHRYVKSITVGNHHTIIVDDNNQVYTMGLGDLGQLGHGHRKSLTIPKKIETFKSTLATPYSGLKGQQLQLKTDIISLACGKDHTLLLTSGGIMFSWGDNRRGQLGHHSFDTSAIPKVVVDADCKPMKNVLQISCGQFHSACLSGSGLIYTWGNGDCLGTSPHYRHENEVETKMPDACYPTLIPIFHRKKMVQVICGENHCAAVAPGEVYAWGSNQYGQLGLGHTRPQYIPKKLSRLEFDEFDTIHAKLFSGGRHMMFVLKGKIWTWGWNKYGQIGDGSLENALFPVSIDPLKLTSNPSLSPMASGSPPPAPNKPPTPSPSMQHRKQFLREDPPSFREKRGAGMLTSKKKTPGKVTLSPNPQVRVLSAALTWRTTVVLTQHKELFAWGVINNIVPLTKSLRVTNFMDEEPDLYLGDPLHEPFEMSLKPRLLAINEVLQGQHMKDSMGNDLTLSVHGKSDQNSLNQCVMGLNGCGNFALSFVGVELETTALDRIFSQTHDVIDHPLGFTTPMKQSSALLDSTMKEIQGMSIKTPSSATSRLKAAVKTVNLLSSSQRKGETPTSKGKYSTVMNKNTKFTKEITTNPSSEEVLKRFREELGRATLYPSSHRKTSHPRTSSFDSVQTSSGSHHYPSEEAKLSHDGSKTKPKKTTSILDVTGMATIRSRRPVPSSSSHDGTDDERQLGMDKEEGDFVDLFNPALLKKMKVSKQLHQERIQQLQRDLQDKNMDFSFSFRNNSPTRSRPLRSDGGIPSSEGGGNGGNSSFLQNFLQSSSNGVNGSPSRWRNAGNGDSITAGRRLSGSPLSRFMGSKASTDNGYEELLSSTGKNRQRSHSASMTDPANPSSASTTTNRGRNTRDSFIWIAGGSPNATRTKGRGSLSAQVTASPEASEETIAKETKSNLNERTRRAKLFSPAATNTLLTNDSPTLSFKEQMHELGYLRKKTTPRFLFSENSSPLINVDANKLSQSVAPSSMNQSFTNVNNRYQPSSELSSSVTPGTFSRRDASFVSKNSSSGNNPSGGSGNNRNSLEKLKRELVYMQQQQQQQK